MKSVILHCLLVVIALSIHSKSIAQTQGKYFAKKHYIPEPIPSFEARKNELPSPVLDSHPEWIDMYWKCWEIAFKGFKSPPEGSPLVSNWLDEAFSPNIFQWDTIFMIMFARYGHDIFPAIQSLDNFYCLQRESGYICREFREKDGRMIHYDEGDLFHPMGWKNTINPPLFSWAEVESFRITGDKSRFELVLPALDKYAQWLDNDGDPDAENWEENGRRSMTAEHKLYWNTPLGSGMDNTPRPAEKGSGWVEMSSQMVIMYNNLAVIAEELGDGAKAGEYRSKAQEIGDRVNRWCWNEEDGLYYDVREDGSQFGKKTSGCFWPLLANISSRDQAARLVEHLKNPEEFWRPIVFPTLSADEEEYRPDGGYWLGSVWAPTNVMIVKGLENYGYEDFATEATENYLTGMAEVFEKTGTVWENYAPESFQPGEPSKADFVGWTGSGPIALLIENILGLRPDGVRNQLTWHLKRIDRHGIENLRVGDVKVRVISEKRDSKSSPARLNVTCDKAFSLTVVHPSGTKTFALKAGDHSLEIE
ncbi:MAG: trehalase family glycosidase [Candidatus Neomarinimicrobiota bacterium]